MTNIWLTVEILFLKVMKLISKGDYDDTKIVNNVYMKKASPKYF